MLDQPFPATLINRATPGSSRVRSVNILAHFAQDNRFSTVFSSQRLPKAKQTTIHYPQKIETTSPPNSGNSVRRNRYCNAQARFVRENIMIQLVHRGRVDEIRCVDILGGKQ